ncbi:hypothetical protein V500_08969 [Pseudogymnoascus sp. VKM F-4518 (FW-2643)]|nr:hypothetical protein V500_08969 [Pseudogymnoascus sp. VKM F-4518 (FW-2643)]KFZ14630.1 hypothetical protein V502_05971 [Pseudogymnoascus sp. VKM F-4520 (FW-2644)]
MVTKSSFPDIDVPPVDVWGLLFERKDKQFSDNKVIYVDPETNRSYTFAETKKAAIEFGKGLKAQWDWKKGDVLALYTPNSIDTPAVIWGTHWAGGVISPANPAYTPAELAFQLKDSGAKALVTQKAFLADARAAAKSVGLPEKRIIILGDERDELFKHFTSIRNISGATRYARTRVNPEKDLAFLVYSSGTTGHPKGVMLSHRNIVSNLFMLAAGEGNNLSSDGGPDGKGDKLLAFLPFFHIYGLTCLIHYAFFRGLTIYVMAKFDLERFCSIIQENKITFAYAVPPVVLQLAKNPVVDKYDLSSIRMMSSGAAPLTREIVNALYDKRNIKVKQGYGLSETSPTTHSQRWEDWQTAMGSVGPLLPNQTAKFMSAEEKELAVGETGELWVKGPNVFLGYWKNPEGTKNALTDDGYFKTGDVGFQDKKGNFYITDRVKELIKYKGFQVPPAELEGLLVSHPDVDDVAVLGIYNEDQATEVPRAYVVPKNGVPGTPETGKNIADWLATKVAGHKRLRGGVRFVDVIPKTASGKILRRVLKQQAEEEEKKVKSKL